MSGTDREGELVVLPLDVGTSTFAVGLQRVATVLRTSTLDRDVDVGDTIELSEHEIRVHAAAGVLGEERRDSEAFVVFHGKDDEGLVPGWLVDDVGDPQPVTDIERTAGAIRYVRGRVDVDDGQAVLVDPAKIHFA